MMEIKMLTENQDESQRLNEKPSQNEEKQEKDFAASDIMLSAISTNGTQIPAVQGTSSTIPAQKKSNFMDPIYRLLGFNRKTTSNGTECTTREIGTLIILAVLGIIFIVSFTGFVIMWFTDLYNHSFVSKLVLLNNSVAAEWWMKPPVNPLLKVHIFNYTNADRFMQGLDSKLHVEDIGPYTYVENATKVNVTFNKDHTITYKEYRSYEFQPRLSKGKMHDKVIVPNVPFLSVLAAARSEKLSKLSFHVAMFTQPKLFLEVPAHDLLWGYEDDIIDLSKTFSSLPFDKFGMLVTRNGTSRDTFQINTGEDDIRKLGIISKFNGNKLMSFWLTEECNRVDGSDGSQFPPHLLNKKDKLEVYIQAMCRKLPLVFDSEVDIFHGVPAWRYKTPLNVFANPDINPDNQCFCARDARACPPNGLFNGTLCYDAPIFVSFPHFFTGDPAIYSKHLEGIAPNASIHQTFADIHPRLGFPMDGASRIQINVEVNKMKKSTPVETKNLEQGAILPVVWLEVTSGALTDDLRALIYHSTYSANAIHFALRYGSLLSWVTSLALIFGTFYYRNRNQNKKSTAI